MLIFYYSEYLVCSYSITYSDVPTTNLSMSKYYNKSKLSVFFRHVLFRHRYKLCIYLGPCKGIVARFTISLQLFVEECCWWFGVYKVNTYLLKVRSPCIIQCVPLFFARQSFRYLSADFQANLSNEHFIKQRSSNSLF